MLEGENDRSRPVAILREYLGGPSGREQAIKAMEIKDMEKELAVCGWV